MQIIVGLMIGFLLMLTGPVIGAAIYYKKREGTVLHINQERVRDPRYFGKAFASMVEKGIANSEGNKIRLSREEAFFDGDKHKDYKECMEELVICQEKEFCPPASVKEFRKEIYSGENAKLTKGELKLRAVCSKKKMILGNNVTVLRWADAEETLTVYDNCDLGISASAGRKMSIGRNCQFRRLYAPVILIGQYPDSTVDPTEGKDPRIFRLPVETSKEKNMRYISKEMINEEGVVDFSVLSWRNVTVTEKIIVQGDVRSHKGVRLCDDAVVCGNLFAEGDVLLGKNAAVLGSIFSQGSIYFEERATAGQQGRISSVIARDTITFEKNNFVFGYVSCEKTGRIGAEENHVSPSEFQFLEAHRQRKHLEFKDLYDYEHVDNQGFRKEPDLEDVVIVKGAKQIQRSMFFNCEALCRVALPPEIQRIGDYAFADCYELKELAGFSNMQLEEIETSSFENCRELSEIVFPSTVKRLGGAAFGGCVKLHAAVFPEDSELEAIGDHCFNGCSSLKELWLPDGVNVIGVSAFCGCTGLKRLSLPEGCRNEPGITELAESSELEIVYRRAAGETVSAVEEASEVEG